MNAVLKFLVLVVLAFCAAMMIGLCVVLYGEIKLYRISLRNEIKELEDMEKHDTKRKAD